jgi:hypothetical protein
MKYFICLITLIFAISFAYSFAEDFKRDTIDLIKINAKDLPQGYVYGTLPDYAKKGLLIKDNPSYMDKSAIKKCVQYMYPNGDYSQVKEVHSSIITKKETPYGDDIVCYIIVYHNTNKSKKEMKKLADYSEVNKDRVILLSKNNLIVFMHVDSINNYPLLKDLAKKIEERMKGI